MGISFSSILNRKLVHNVAEYVKGKKRRHSETEDDINKVIDIALQTPKRKKLTSTSQYIYQALFEEGKNSDVTVCALGEDFRLHKVYLCQSPYFASMFGGSWLETTQKCIAIDVVDPLITKDSLKIVLGSLYNSEIILNPLDIVSILATATMFQLDALIDKCTEVMVETINTKTALIYYNASCRYGDKKLQDVCFKWFLVNLMTHYVTHLDDLKTIPIGLMTKLIAHPDLIVMQTEYSLYVMLKYWMYLFLFNDCDPDQPSKFINNYFSTRNDEVAFLLTEDGQQFMETFKGLRLHNLLSHKTDVELVIQDNIIPRCWLNPIIFQQWKNILRINQNEDKGPQNFSEEEFFENSLRCGRILQMSERHVWRWTGFHFGIDLIVMTDGASVSVKRNHRSDTEQLLSSQVVRHIAIRMKVIKLNAQRQIVYFKETEVRKLALTKNEEIQIMTLDKDLTYPILVSANILYTSQDGQPIRQEDTIIHTVS